MPGKFPDPISPKKIAKKTGSQQTAQNDFKLEAAAMNRDAPKKGGPPEIAWAPPSAPTPRSFWFHNGPTWLKLPHTKIGKLVSPAYQKLNIVKNWTVFDFFPDKMIKDFVNLGIGFSF